MSEAVNPAEPGRNTYVASWRLLQERGFEVATVIDVGAAEGAFFVIRSQRSLFGRAPHFFIDAMRENEPVYRRIAAKYGGGYEIAALSCMEGEVELRLDPDFYNTHIEHLQRGSGYTETRRVPMATLDGVVERHALRAPFAIKIDVQGAELDVLRGALRSLEQAVIVTAEIQIFFERDTIVELLAFMQANGWSLYDLTNLSYYPSDGTFYQCYATFIPKAMDFRQGTPWCPPGREAEALAQLQARRRNALLALDELLGQS